MTSGAFLVGSIRSSRQKAESASEIANPDTTNGPVIGVTVSGDVRTERAGCIPGRRVEYSLGRHAAVA